MGFLGSSPEIQVQLKSWPPWTSEISAKSSLSTLLTLEGNEGFNYDIFSLILDDNGHPRLKCARREFLPLTREKIPILKEAHRFWSAYDEFLHLEHRKTLEHAYVKCSKRGNDVYNWRLENSLGFLKAFRDFELFALDEFKNKAVIRLDRALIWRTLTFDSKLCSLDEAWLASESWFERSISRLKREYGEENVSYIAFVQPFPGEGPARGYPHYHILLLIENGQFHVFGDMEESGGTLKMVYRLTSEDEDHLNEVIDWHSPVEDTKVLRNGAHVYNYCFKYVQNVVTGSCDPGTEAYEKSSLTNSILWLYRKRAFTMSGDFRESYSALMRRLHNSKPKQLNFEGEEVPEEAEKRSEWRVVGFTSGEELEELLGRPPGWVETVSAEVVGRAEAHRRGVKFNGYNGE